jgi:hypothetical protein
MRAQSKPHIIIKLSKKANLMTFTNLLEKNSLLNYKKAEAEMDSKLSMKFNWEVLLK